MRHEQIPNMGLCLFVLCVVLIFTIHALSSVTGYGFVIKASGEDVTLLCKLDNDTQVSRIEYFEWSGPNIHLSGLDDTRNPRFSTAFINTTREYSLTITHARVDDSGGYLCDAMQTFHLFHLEIEPVTPGQPIVWNTTNDMAIQRNVNQSMSLVCQSKGGDPPANITWWKDGEILSTNSSYVWKDEGESESTAMYVFTPQVSDQGSVLECRAANTVTHQALSTKVTLRLKAAPRYVALTGSDVTQEGDLAKFYCVSVDSFPEVNMTWEYNGSKYISSRKVETNETTGAFTVTSETEIAVTRTDNKLRIQCNVVHMLLPEPTVRTETVLVAFGPDFADAHVTHTKNSATPSTLYTCISSVSYPAVEFKWIIGRRQYNFSHSSQYLQASHGGVIQVQTMLLNETISDDTDVVCIVTNTLVPELTVSEVVQTVSQQDSSETDMAAPVLGTIMTIAVLCTLALLLYPRVKQWRRETVDTNTQDTNTYENYGLAMSDITEQRPVDVSRLSADMYTDLQLEHRTTSPESVYDTLEDSNYTNTVLN